MIEIDGTSFVVMSTQDDGPEPEGRIVIRMPPLPPRVRGAGWNTDTKHCIAGLVDLYQDGDSVLDLGVGSGLIAVVAWKLGANPVYATEHNPLTLAFAQQVLDINKVGIEVLSSHEGLPHVDICVANVGADYAYEIRRTIDAGKIITAENDTGEMVIFSA